MSNVTVRCGCGRQMSEVGNAPKGTFRCGCGQRVLVSGTDRVAACVGLSEAGRRCGFPPIREAAELGQSLCIDHYAGYCEILDLISEGNAAMHWLRELTLGAEGNHLDGYPICLVPPLGEEYDERRWFRGITHSEAVSAHELASVVYYIRIGDTVKIGTTTNMRSRMAALMPDEILATEPGGLVVERERHEQFADLKADHLYSSERFWPEEPLLAHIAKIRKEYGPPKLTGPLAQKVVNRSPRPRRPRRRA